MPQLDASLACLVVLSLLSVAAAPPATQPSREQQLQELLTGASLKGFAITGNAEPVEDEYPIARAAPLFGDRWLIAAEVEGIPVPLIVPIRWAGDTPVISVTDLKVPGLGTYSARVVIHGEQYAGTWSGGERSGFIWGRILRPSATQPATKAPAAPLP